MAGLLFLFTAVLGGASLLFREAAGQISIGTPWASSVCSVSKMFCAEPMYLAYAAGAALVLAIGVKLGGELS